MSNSFQPGDVVVLKSDHRVRFVIINQGNNSSIYNALWFNGENQSNPFQYRDLPAVALMLAPQQTDTISVQ